MVRKIRRRKSTFRAESDGLAYEDEDGEEFFPRVGQWVDFKRKMSGNDYGLMASFIELSERVDIAEKSENRDAISEANLEMFRAIPAMLDFISGKVVAWNWTDLDREPDSEGNFPLLPEPSREVVGNLDFEIDTTHLIEMLMGSTEPEKN